MLSRPVKSSIKYVAFCLASSFFNFGPRTIGRAKRQDKTPKYFLSAMIRVKNEARFLPELIAHHHLIGVEHFYIYDNNSTDDLEVALRPLIELGIVTIINWPKVPASPSCHKDFFENHGQDSEWVAFIDADEFIVENPGSSLIEVLKKSSRYPAIGVNWEYFGSSHHEKIPDGLVMENFTQCDGHLDTHVKVLVRPDRVRAYFNSHNFAYRGFGLARSQAGRFVFGSHCRPSQTPDIRINHYVYRSRENYDSKSTQGFVDKSGAKEQARRLEKSDLEFNKHNSGENRQCAGQYGARVRAFLKGLGFDETYTGACARNER